MDAHIDLMDLEAVVIDERFQAACQRYAHGIGTSQAIAFTAVRAYLISVDLPCQQQQFRSLTPKDYT